ncbi:FAD-dependent monooxygenase [Verrucosispora sp. NA02020]|uniref:FAD-dependent monooxygenase n=1 Tax=Verrucosispora sp. NA02020 TaxID=2742132 RepID=UPI0015921C6A|nr:FAD-dependent monooxygenase [Verrucosispora sp. NA02020]QKW15003.1 FAD-dependent monooxygenase [Verrucosispora sp. NA02020]
MRILVVGGGIAGSTLAVALRHAGLDPLVAEARHSRDALGGAFLTLAPNGVNALRAIGLGDVPSAADGFEVSGLDMHNARGRRIAELAGEHDLDRYGARGVVLRRARLHAELTRRAQAAGARYRFGARLVDLRHHAAGVTAVFADDETVEVDAVIGADGIWSTVRRLTWPDAPRPRYTGIVDCGGWTTVDLPDTSRQQMYFGHRAFFGYVVRDSLAYWFTNVPRRDEPERTEFDNLDHQDWMTRIRELHAEDPAPVRAVLGAANRSLGAWPLYDLPDLPTWHTSTVCLVGDAAHAVSPSTGQGASLAIEDAVVLARHLGEGHRPETAFAGFVAERKTRAEKIVRFGRQIGDRKASSAAGNLFRDLTLGFFLRMGAKAAREQYAYRVPQRPEFPYGPGATRA